MQAATAIGILLVAPLISQLAASNQPLDDDLLEAELSDSLYEQLMEPHFPHHRHHHGNHRHGHRRFRGLRMPSPRPHAQWASLAMAEPAKVVSAANPDAHPDAQPLLTKRHPAVEHVLSSMHDEMQELRAKKMAAGNARGHLQDMVADTAEHMNEAVNLKHEMAKKEAKIQAQQERLRSLEASETRLDRTRDNLGDSLHHIMDAKIQSAESRLEKKQVIVQKMRDEVDKWQEKGDSYKASALQLLEDRKVAQEGLEESDEALAAAQREEENAQKGLKLAAKRADEEVEAYRYVESKFSAARSRESEGEDDVHQAEKSVQKLRGILDMEQGRIDQATTIGKDKLQGKIRKLQANEDKNSKELDTLRQEYGEWQKHQRGRVEEVAQAQATTNELSNAFHDQQDQVLDAASDKVVKQAVDESDWGWDGWPSEQDGDSYNVHFTDAV